VGLEVDLAMRQLMEAPQNTVQRTVLAYQATLIRQEYAPATVNRRIASIRAVLALGRAADLTTNQLGAVQDLDPEPNRDVRGPGIDVVRRLIAACDADEGLRGARDATLLRWLLLGALRREEVRRVAVGDLRLADESPYVLIAQKGKRRRPRFALCDPLVDATRSYLEAHRGDRPGPLFPSLDRRHPWTAKLRPLSASGINRIVEKRAAEIGFPGGIMPDGRRITPHAIRHTAGTVVARSGGLLAAQKFLRHASTATTMRYLDDGPEVQREAQLHVASALAELT
jgi:integrase